MYPSSIGVSRIFPPGIKPFPWAYPLAIDRNNPLAAGLSYCHLISWAADFHAGFQLTGLLDPSAGFKEAPWAAGMGMTDNGSAAGFLSFSNTDYQLPAAAGTVLCHVTAGFSPTDGNRYYPFSMGSTPFPAGPAFEIQKFSDNNLYAGWWSGSNTRASVAAAGLWSAGETFTIACTWSGTGTKLYVKGLEVASNGAAPSTGTTTNRIMCIGTFEQNTSYAWCKVGGGSFIYSTIIWERELSAQEVARLETDTYGFLLSRPMSGKAVAQQNSNRARLIGN